VEPQTSSGFCPKEKAYGIRAPHSNRAFALILVRSKTCALIRPALAGQSYARAFCQLSSLKKPATRFRLSWGSKPTNHATESVATPQMATHTGDAGSI
jgi:hypothetical protein